LKVRRRENAVKGEQRGKKEAHASNHVKRSPVRKCSVKERRISARNNTEKQECLQENIHERKMLG
jgi:hypothetical protein